MTDGVTTPSESPRSRVQIWRSREGQASWNVCVFAGDSEQQLEETFKRAIALDRLLQEELG